jgi:hypothetical protein
MVEKESEKGAETQLLEELLAGRRPLQAYTARLLSKHCRMLERLCSVFFKLDKSTPDPAVLQQFVNSFDAVEETLAKIAGLPLKRSGTSEIAKRFQGLDFRRQEQVNRKYRSILATLEINATKLTVAKQRKLKALLRKGSGELAPELGDDEEFLVAMLSELLVWSAC